MKTNKYTSVHKTGAELFWQSSKTVLTINAHRKKHTNIGLSQQGNSAKMILFLVIPEGVLVPYRIKSVTSWIFFSR